MKKIVISIFSVVVLLSCFSISALAYRHPIVYESKDFTQDYYACYDSVFYTYYHAAGFLKRAWASTELSTPNDSTGYADVHITGVNNYYNYQKSDVIQDGFFKSPAAYTDKYGVHAKGTTHYAERQIYGKDLDSWEVHCD